MRVAARYMAAPTVIRAHALGFSGITARGFDIAPERKIQRARLAARNLSSLPGVSLHVRRRRSCGPVTGTGCLGRSDSLPVQRAQPSARRTPAGNLKRDRTRHIGIFHNDGASDWQHANGLVDSIEKVRPIETRSRQGPVRNRPQRRRHIAFSFPPVYSGRIAEPFRQLLRH